MRTWILLPVLALALPLAACGDDTGGTGGAGGSDASSTSTEATSNSSASGTPTSVSASGGSGDAVEVLAACPASVDAEVTNTGSTAFSPAMFSVPAGGVVKFSPQGPHDMTSDDASSWKTTNGDEACIKFNDPGEYPFHCSFHAVMKGVVTVN